MAGRGPKIILQGIVNIAATHKCYTIIKYPFPVSTACGEGCTR